MIIKISKVNFEPMEFVHMWYTFNRMIMQKSTITKADFSSKFLIWAGEKTNIISVFQAFFYHLSHWNDKLHFIFQLFKGVCNSFWFLIKFILNTVVRIRFQYSDEKVIYLCIFFIYIDETKNLHKRLSLKQMSLSWYKN